MNKIVIAVTGASGSVYAKLVLDKLLTIKEQWSELAVIMTANAKEVWKTELDNEDYTAPFIREAQLLNQRAGSSCQYVLLGSIATEKYTRILLEVFGDRLLFPSAFVGRGDMSRGGLMLRCARTAEGLHYLPVEGALRRGKRPPKLGPP